MNQINIGSLAVEKFYLGSSDSVQIYLGDVKLYPQGTPPTPTARYAVTDDLTSYTATTYVDVYNKADDLWYKLNNNDGFEEYGVYGSSTGVSETYYDGKLSVVGDYEYQYSGNSWVNVGEVSANSTSYEITNADPYEYEGVELSTTFKIPVSDVEALGGYLDFTIRTQDGGRLSISTTRYRYMGNGTKNGTVTSDATYYYYELPDIETVTISQIQYWNSTPVHIIVGSTELPVYYPTKVQPNFYMIYDTVSQMETDSDVYDGKYSQIGSTVYKYNNGWEVTSDKIMTGTTLDNSRSFYFSNESGNTNSAKCFINSSTNENNEYNWMYKDSNPIIWLWFNGNTNITKFDFNTIDISQYTAIGANSFYSCSNLREIEIPSGITTINNYAFQLCSSMESMILNEGLTNVGNGSLDFRSSGYTSRMIIPSTVTSMGNNSLMYENDYHDVEFKGTIFLNAFTDNVTTQYTEHYNHWIYGTQANVEAARTNSSYYSHYLSSRVITEDMLNDDTLSYVEFGTGNYKYYAYNTTIYSKSTNGVSITFFDRGSSGVTSGGFTYMESLNSVTIDGFTAITTSSFNGCTYLQYMYIPDSVEYIGGGAFYGCERLQAVRMSRNQNLTTIESNTFYNVNNQLATNYFIDLNNATNIKTIKGSAFNGKTSTTGTSVSAWNVFNNIETIDGNFPFLSTGYLNYCYLLGIKKINGLLTPNTYYSSGSRTLYLTLGPDCEEINSQIMNNASNYYKLYLTMQAETPPALNSTLVNNASYITAIKVPSGSVNAYKAASGWSTYASKIS